MANAVLRAGGRALAISRGYRGSNGRFAPFGHKTRTRKFRFRRRRSPAAAPAAAAAAAAPKSAWVKLCEKAPIVKKGPDGKDVKEEKSLCLTHHERLDGNTGMVLVSAAIREVEGIR